jgi:hypothetical protein
MAFNKEINKTVSVGAYQVLLNDAKKFAQISYSQYEDDVAVSFMGSVNVSFDKLKEIDPEGFNTVMGYLQTLCDSFNPENPDKLNPIDEKVVEG